MYINGFNSVCIFSWHANPRTLILAIKQLGTSQLYNATTNEEGSWDMKKNEKNFPSVSETKLLQNSLEFFFTVIAYQDCLKLWVIIRLLEGQTWWIIKSWQIKLQSMSRLWFRHNLTLIQESVDKLKNFFHDESNRNVLFLELQLFNGQVIECLCFYL